MVDRLSDVAGPLRPKELFAPYLSAYPLPSGAYYVLARTWQDMTVPRAGCVRTKSVLIDAQIWALKPPLIAMHRLLGALELPMEMDAVRIEFDEPLEEHFRRPSNFNASELLEAIFLEDAKPVVVFDAPDPELISLRLLAAMWPDIRKRFALSTFALSPRKIGGRDLDLVFAPSNARGKFSDWPGRRVDGRALQSERHRWTGTIVGRVFDDPLPRLLSQNEIDLLGDREADSPAALRITLLWDELLDKLDQMPTAALGLLDIANSGMISDVVALKTLEPRLAEATLKAGNNLSLKDAWDFVGAITRKMQGHDMATGWAAVQQLAAHLAEQAPDGAISLLGQPDPMGAISNLTPSIAMGLGNGVVRGVEEVLVDAPAEIFARLILQGGALANRVTGSNQLIRRMGIVLTEIDQALANRVGAVLLPLLVEDRQLPIAEPIFCKLDLQEIAVTLRWLGEVNNFQAEQLCTLLIDRAREIGRLLAVREVLILSKPSVRRDGLIARTIEPTEQDVLWLLNEEYLPKAVSTLFLLDVLRRADDMQFETLLTSRAIGGRIIARLPSDAVDMLVRTVLQGNIAIDAHVRIIQLVIPQVSEAKKFEIAERVIEKCLRNRFDGIESELLSMLLGILGTRLNGEWVAKTGLDPGIATQIVNRNLVAFEQAPLHARKRIVGAVDEIARALVQRDIIDLDEMASDACAKLFIDAEKTSHMAVVNAARLLMPLLLRARHQPISLLIAALFPQIYRNLGKSSDLPTFMWFVPFLDWSPRKAARHELVDAFKSSSWRAGDLALTACRCGDVEKILKLVAWSSHGTRYLERIESDLLRLDHGSQRLVKLTIAEIRSDG